jgi:MYXO-CTERM domain-containing protein
MGGPSGGTTGKGGTAGSGGTSAAGGATGTGGSSAGGKSGGTSTTGGGQGTTRLGCSCAVSTAGSRTRSGLLALLVLGAVVLGRRRRR